MIMKCHECKHQNNCKAYWEIWNNPALKDKLAVIKDCQWFEKDTRPEFYE